MSTPEQDASLSASTGDDELLAALADELSARFRRREHPTVEEYVARHPSLAERIRKVFSAVAMIEQARPMDDASDCEGPGSTIGRYKLLERIGEGGFGVVYMAEQLAPVRRKVALKLIKPGMDSRQVLARFEVERQALAIMDHPHIAKVFDGGMTDSGRPYFVMELVKGEPITTYCDNHHLPTRARLELFVQVCDAVQHAHQKGIIHRDLKPSNVLVAMHDATPVIKVIDFGVAKALGQELTDRTLFTGFAQLLGTPLYMSPEQAGQSSLDVDTRSDIYSLGVLLYELLTGTTPFDKERFKQAAQDEIRRIIREEEPPRPSTRLSESKDSLASISALRHTEPAKLTKLVRGELDWIVMKTLEKDRSRRYETANGLARDIDRYLRNETVEACPPSIAYRLRKFARRNKTTLVTSSLIGLALLLAVGNWGRAVRERTARHARVAGQVELILGEVDQLQAEQKWPEALAGARRAEAVVTGGEADAATMRRARERLKDLEFLEQLEQTRMRQSIWLERSFDNAGADREYGRVFREYGVDVDQLDAQTAIARFKARPSIGMPVAAALDHWAVVRRNLKTDSAAQGRLADIAREIDPDPLRNKVRLMWNKPVAEAADELRHLAESIDVRAHHPATLVRVADALEQAKQRDAALHLFRATQQAYPGDFWANFYLAQALHAQNDFEGAARFNTAAVAIRPNSIAALNNLGNAMQLQGELDEAVAAYRRAVEIDPKFLYGTSNLGRLLHTQGKLDDAAIVLRKAIEIDPKYSAPYSRLIIVLRSQKKLDEAAKVLHAGLQIDPPDAAFYNYTAWLLVTDADVSIHDPASAVKYAETAVALAPKDSDYWNTLGVARYRAGDWQGAIDALQKFREVRVNDEEWGAPFFLAMAHWQIGEKETARKWYGTGVDWMYNKAPRSTVLMTRFRSEAADLLGVNEKRPTDVSTAAVEAELAAMQTQALSLSQSGEIDQAAEIMERAVTRAQGALPREHDLLCDLRITRAQLLIRRREFGRAEAELLDLRANGSLAYRVGARDALLQLYKDWEKPEKALLLLQQRMNSARTTHARTDQSWRITVYQLEYAKALLDLKRFQDAEAVLSKAYTSAEPDQRATVAQRLVELYAAWDKPAAVAKWRRIATTAPSATLPTSATMPTP